MGLITVLNPTAAALARRHADLRGKTLGFLNNRKANAGLLLARLEELLRARCGPFTVVKAEKNAAMPAPEAAMTSLSVCDAVVTAIGD